MKRTLFIALSLSLTGLAGGITAAQAADFPPLPTTTLMTALIGRQGADDEFNAGVEAQRKQQWDKAVVAFSNAIKKDPTYWVAFYSRGDCYYQLGQFEKAIADYTQVIDKKPKLADAFRFRGRCYIRLKQYDKAIEDLTKVLQLVPGRYEAYGDLGAAYQGKNDYKNAIDSYTAFIDKLRRTRQSIPEVYSNRAQVYLAKYQADKAENKANEDDVKAALADFEQYIAEATAKNQDPSDAYRYRGDAYLITKNYDKAISNYSLYLSKNAKDTYTLERRGAAYAGVKNVDLARKDFEQALALNPTSTYAKNGLNEMMIEGDNPEQALPGISKSINDPPKRDQKDKVATRALIYMKIAEKNPASASSNYALAIKDYDFVISTDPQDTSARLNRATANLKLNAYDKALADYNAYLAMKPSDASGVNTALTGKAAALVSLKQYDQAADTFTQIIANNEAAKKDDPDAYYNRGKAYFNMKAYDRAIPDLTRYTKAKPDDKDAAKLLSDAEFSEIGTKGFDAQVAFLKDRIAKEPANIDIQLNLGALYYTNKKYDEAITAYSGAIATDAKNSTAYYGRAAAYKEKKDWDNVIKDTTSALALKPDYADALNLRAPAYLETKKYPDAIKDYEAIYAKNPGNADALKGLAAAYVANKDYANTVRIMNDYIPKNPNDLEAVYSRGVANVGLMKYQEGIADLTKYISSNGKDQATALYNRGLANAKMGNDDAAAADFEASLAQKNDYNVALEGAKAYSVLGDKFRDSDPMKATGLYGKAYDVYGKALAALDAPDANKTDLPKKRAEVIRSQAVVRQYQGKLAENLDILKDALSLFNKYLDLAKPLNLPDVADTQKIADQLAKYIKDNS